MLASLRPVSKQACLHQWSMVMLETAEVLRKGLHSLMSATYADQIGILRSSF